MYLKESIRHVICASKIIKKEMYAMEIITITNILSNNNVRKK